MIYFWGVVKRCPGPGWHDKSAAEWDEERERRRERRRRMRKEEELEEEPEEGKRHAEDAEPAGGPGADGPSSRGPSHPILVDSPFKPRRGGWMGPSPLPPKGGSPIVIFAVK